MNAPLKIFIIYAREDEPFKNSLLAAFVPLRRAGKIEVFHDALIKPGDRWEDVILENLRTAHVILPLVSNDFFVSEFIHEGEFKKAVDRYAKGETVIMPIILKHCGWKYDPILKTLQVLPKDGKPVVTWTYQEEAWEQVVDAVHEVTEQVKGKVRVEQKQQEAEAKRKKEKKEALQRRKKAEPFFNLGILATDNYEKIKHYSKAIEVDPQYAEVYNKRGLIKDKLELYTEALRDYNQAISIDPENVDAYINRGWLKRQSKHYQESIEDYDQVISINPKYAHAYFGRGRARDELEQHREAIEDFSQALYIDQNNFCSYVFRGIAKENLGLLYEAQLYYQKALNINPTYEFATSRLNDLQEKLK